eukprot:CAMPEP_0172572906 /NCGR_PEP_ID=MMETSP1067-20121228/135917_1 /TAXON_ID=265564 ORGANISM="Thalassiosira punctigera, Strain Tpunct2005C2" /NCGR_SAMPLE_ID=MMETSP1067 /ASSEMBLY_ACC=CAM_ASM_000444 /LENGTH=375 /DNA_ID=CAMNT_0013365497 /DNA_START=4021 /DNA_END=5148 /DNA_ORIENTATION=+
MSPTPPTFVAITAFRLMLSRPGPLVWPACHHCFVQWQKEKDVLFFPLHFPAKKSSQPLAATAAHAAQGFPPAASPALACRPRDRSVAPGVTKEFEVLRLQWLLRRRNNFSPSAAPAPAHRRQVAPSVVPACRGRGIFSTPAVALSVPNFCRHCVRAGSATPRKNLSSRRSPHDADEPFPCVRAIAATAFFWGRYSFSFFVTHQTNYFRLPPRRPSRPPPRRSLVANGRSGSNRKAAVVGEAHGPLPVRGEFDAELAARGCGFGRSFEILEDVGDGGMRNAPPLAVGSTLGGEPCAPDGGTSRASSSVVVLRPTSIVSFHLGSGLSFQKYSMHFFSQVMSLAKFWVLYMATTIVPMGVKMGRHTSFPKSCPSPNSG